MLLFTIEYIGDHKSYRIIQDPRRFAFVHVLHHSFHLRADYSNARAVGNEFQLRAGPISIYSIIQISTK